MDMIEIPDDIEIPNPLIIPYLVKKCQDFQGGRPILGYMEEEV